MNPINKKTTITINNDHRTTPTLLPSPSNEEKDHLIPFVDFKDGKVNWNFHQNPSNLDDFSFAEQLYDTTVQAINEKRGKFPERNPKEFANIFKIALQIILCWDTDKYKQTPSFHNVPETLTQQHDEVFKMLSTFNDTLLSTTTSFSTDSQLVPIIEELFVISVPPPDVHIAYKILTDSTIVIPNDERAYIYYLFFLFATFTNEFGTAQKILSAIKKRFGNVDPDFKGSAVLKKLNILLLSKNNPLVAAQILQHELEKNTVEEIQRNLLCTSVILFEMKLYKECLSDLSRFSVTNINRCVYLKIKCQALYEIGFWDEALKIGEEILTINIKSPLKNWELPFLEIVTAIYRFKNIECKEEVINRIVITKHASYTLLHTFQPFFLRLFTNSQLHLFYNDKVKRSHPIITGIASMGPWNDAFAEASTKLIRAVINSMQLGKVTPHLTKISHLKFSVADVHYCQYLNSDKKNILDNIKLLKTAISNNRLHLDALFYLASTYFYDCHCISEALLHITKCVEFSSEPKAEWLFLATKIEIANLNFSKATLYCQKFLFIKPGDAAGIIERGIIHSRNNNLVAATESFLEACLSPSTTPLLSLRALEKLLEICPDYPNFIQFLNPFLECKSFQLKANFLLAKYHLIHLDVVEAKKAITARGVKDEDNAYLKARLVMETDGPLVAIEVLSGYLINAPKSILLRKLKMEIAILLGEFDMFCSEYSHFLGCADTPLDYCVKLLALLNEKCKKTEKSLPKFIELCDITLRKFPNHSKLIQLKNLIGNLFNPQYTSEVLGTDANSNKIISEEISTSKLDLKVLVSQNRHGVYTWNFDQDDWLLDPCTWFCKLLEDFKKNLNLKYSNFYENISERFKNAEEKENYYAAEKKSLLEYFENTLPKSLDKIEHREKVFKLCELMEHLYLLEMFNHLNDVINFVLTIHGQQFLTPSDNNYVHYIYLMMNLLAENNNYGLARVIKFLETLPVEPTPFYEKLKILIATQYQNTLTLYMKVEKSLELFQNIPPLHSLYFLKMHLLILMTRIEECSIALSEVDPSLKTRQEYFRIRCIVQFSLEPWSEVRKTGEDYFNLIDCQDLRREDLTVALCLSVIYRYTGTLGNEVIFTRLINTLKNPNQQLIKENSAFGLFIQTVMNFIFNDGIKDCHNFQIPYLTNDHSLMKLAKKNIIETCAKLKLKIVIEEHPIIEVPNKTNGSFTVEYSSPDLCYHYALKEFNNVNMDKALIEANKVLDLCPIHFETKHLKAYIFYRQGQYEEAENLIQPVLEKKINGLTLNREFAHLSILCSIGLGRLIPALTHIDEWLKANPLDPNFLLLKGDVLNSLNDLPNARKCFENALQTSLMRSEKLEILQVLVFSFPEINLKLLLEFLNQIIDGSNDNIELEARRMRCHIYLKENEITQIKNEFAYFVKKEADELYIEACIEVLEGRYEQAQEVIKRCQKSLNKSYKSISTKKNLYFDLPSELRILKLCVFKTLGNFQSIVCDHFDWIKPSTSKSICLKALELFTYACEKLEENSKINYLSKVSERCHLILKIHKDFLEVSSINEQVTNKLLMRASQERENIHEAIQIVEAPLPTPSLQLSAPQVMDKKSSIIFDFSHKPNLYLSQEKGTTREIASEKVHPAKAKQLHLIEEQAQKEIEKMYEIDPTQLSVGMTMNQILIKQFGPFDADESEVLPVKHISKPPKEILTSRVKSGAIKLTPSSTVILVPPEHMRRFERALSCALQLRETLTLLNDQNLTVNPIYRSEEFASRLIIIHLFKFFELLKPPTTKFAAKTKKIPNADLFVVNVKKIMIDKDIRLLRNLIALYGHRTSYKDLITFCHHLFAGKVIENLECLIKKQIPQDPPVELKINYLFPIAFQNEWLLLNVVEKLKVLKEVSNIELDFVRDLETHLKLDIFSEEAKDIFEILKGSVLRIGKSLSRIRREIQIEFTDIELNEVCSASVKVRHQLLSFNQISSSQELKAEWLGKFMKNHLRIREKINNIICTRK